VKVKTVTLLFAAVLFVFGYSHLCVGAEPVSSAKRLSPSVVQSRMLNNISLQKKINKIGNKWAVKRAVLLQHIQQMKEQDLWLEHQIKQYKAYIKEERQTIAELHRRQQILSHINMVLDPYLDSVTDRLSMFIKSDLPFLKEAREARVNFLRHSLDDYNTGLGERLRRVLHALEIESKYGMEITSYEQDIKINGRPTDVRILRLGRVAMFFVTLDGQEAGKFDKQSGKWVLLPSKYAQAIDTTIEISQRKMAAKLVDLPIGRLEK